LKTYIKEIKQMINKSLAKSTLLSIGIRISIIVTIMAFLSYHHIVNILEEQTLDKLEKYITERADKESIIFKLAQDNHNTFKQAYLELWSKRKTANANPRFDQLFNKQNDGTLRLTTSAFTGFERSHTSSSDYKGESRWISGFIGRGAPVANKEFRNRVLLSYDLVDQFAQGWSNRFANTYVSLPEGVNIVYWENLNWAAGASSDLDIPEEEWVYIANKKNNPQRKSVWTGLYYDQTADEWMVSCETPIDDEKGEHLINVGHDILLNNLFQRVFDDRLEGTHNFIIRKDGRLIAHPSYVELIQKAHGLLNISELKDTKIVSQYQNISESIDKYGNKPQIINDSASDVFIAIAPIEGPEWYFVTVYPKTLLASPAQLTAQFIFFLGFISLIVELVMLYLVLLKKVLHPMERFEKASKLISEAQYNLSPVLSDVNLRKDEMGRLSAAMLSMAEQIHKNTLTMEETIKLRTKELELAKYLAEQQARTDSLTELANRRSFFEIGSLALQQTEEGGGTLSVVMLDVDKFKNINDTYGHAVGDEVLKRIATALQQSLRPTDLCARLGGEEFAILLHNTDLHGAKKVAEKIRVLFTTIVIEADGEKIQFTASFGVSQLTSKGEQLDDLLKLADERLYKAKNSGRNCIVSQ